MFHAVDVHLHLAVPGPGMGAGWENDDVMLGKGEVRGGSGDGTFTSTRLSGSEIRVAASALR
jgi:hypothetical protein